MQHKIWNFARIVRRLNRIRVNWMFDRHEICIVLNESN